MATAAVAGAAGPSLPPELLINLPPDCRVPAASTLPLLHQVLEHYAARTPRLQRVVQGVTRPGWPDVARLGHDHLAFRTFGVPGLGIASLERLLLPLGYERAPEPDGSPQAPLMFPAKRLRAHWLRAADPCARAVLPRIFISELQVEKLSHAAQAIVGRYTDWAAKEAATDARVLTSLLTGTPPWPRPSWADYSTLLSESEYAAWVLAHGYSVNHTALALHRLPPPLEGAAGTQAEAAAAVDGMSVIENFVARLQACGLDMNTEGGVVKVSPDGLLLQCAVVADRLPYTFADGDQHTVAGAYVEFAHRLPLPQHKDIPASALREEHRRDGFEVGNADSIFASTTLAAAK